MNSLSSSVGYLNDLSAYEKAPRGEDADDALDADDGAGGVGGSMPVDLVNLHIRSIRDMSPSLPNRRKCAITSLSRTGPCPRARARDVKGEGGVASKRKNERTGENVRIRRRCVAK